MRKMVKFDYVEIKKNRKDKFVAYLYEKDDDNYRKIGVADPRTILLSKYEISLIRYNKTVELEFLDSCIRDVLRQLRKSEYPAVREMYLEKIIEFEEEKAKLVLAPQLDSIILDYNNGVIELSINGGDFLVIDDDFLKTPFGIAKFIFDGYKLFIKTF